jgi:hypothetical protein
MKKKKLHTDQDPHGSVGLGISGQGVVVLSAVWLPAHHGGLWRMSAGDSECASTRFLRFLQKCQESDLTKSPYECKGISHIHETH